MTYLKHAEKVLPKTQLILFSKGQTVTDRVVDDLNSVTTFRSLGISFNEHDAQEYRRVMALDQSRTLVRLRRLHERKLKGELRFNTSLSRVGTSDARDADFLAWCQARFPAFPASSAARFNWIGTQTSGLTGLAPEAGCLQWFSLHILADGNSAFCCIDGRGDDVPGQSLLAIYNAPAKRRLPLQATSRRSVPGCESCLHGMPSIAYATSGTTGV